MDIRNQLLSRTVKILDFINKNEGCNIRTISKELDIDYNYVGAIAVEFANIKLINTTIVNRNKIVNITKKGNELVKLYNKIEAILT